MGQYYLGWDVGGWHCSSASKSCDSLCLVGEDRGRKPSVKGSVFRGNVRVAFDSGDGEKLLAALLRLCQFETSASIRLTIAIDACLGWPDDFMRLLSGEKVLLPGDMKKSNPFLLRETERFLYDHGHRPLSAVQDMIGSQSTKAMLLIHRLRLSPSDTGFWKGSIGKADVELFETYPAPCKKSNKASELYKKVMNVPKDMSQDQVDALYCALIAWFFSKNRTALEQPRKGIKKAEGWIWVPKDCLKTKRMRKS